MVVRSRRIWRFLWGSFLILWAFPLIFGPSIIHGWKALAMRIPMLPSPSLYLVPDFCDGSGKVMWPIAESFYQGKMLNQLWNKCQNDFSHLLWHLQKNSWLKYITSFGVILNWWASFFYILMKHGYSVCPNKRDGRVCPVRIKIFQNEKVRAKLWCLWGAPQFYFIFVFRDYKDT